MAFKTYADSTLMRMTKKELIEHLRIAEHNRAVAEEFNENQYQNIQKILPQHLNKPVCNDSHAWISIQDRKPQYGERVIISNGHFVGEGYYLASGHFSRYDGMPTGFIVRYWMPMPEPPHKLRSGKEIEDDE